MPFLRLHCSEPASDPRTFPPKSLGTWTEHIDSIDQLGNFSCLEDVWYVHDLKLGKYCANKILKTSSHFQKKTFNRTDSIYNKNELRFPKRQMLNTPIPK